MLDYLKSPYPYYYGDRKKLLFGLLFIALISFSFSYSFEPFDVNPEEHRLDYLFICLIHATNPLILGLIFFNLFNAFKINEQAWTIGKELCLLGLFLFIVGIGSFLVRDLIYTNPDNWSMRYVYEEIRNTFLVGMLILFILLPLNLKHLLNKYEQAAKRLSLKKKADLHENQSVKLVTEIEADQIEFNLDDFVYAKMDGNYALIYLNHSDKFEQHLIRITLNELEKQVAKSNAIFRSHRSYLVNKEYIETVKGNAQGYQLGLKGRAEKIPVSRSRISAFNAFVASAD